MDKAEKLNRLQGLYAITDPKLTPPGTLLEKVAAALQGGARIIQYRDKSQDHPRRREEAGALLALCQQFNATFIVNDDVTLAQEVGAHGVHLGLTDTDIADARATLGANKIIGGTCHGEIANARQAQTQGADYVAFGRFFASSTKPDAPLAQLEKIGPQLPSLQVPAVAIGGITLANAPQLRAAGFAMVAVVADIFARENIRAHCEHYAALFE